MLPRLLRWITIAVASVLLLAPAPVSAHGAYAERLAHADARIEAEPRQAEAFVARAGVHFAHGRFDPALADLERARQLEPGRADLALLRGRVLAAAGRHAEAEQVLGAFVAREPGHADAWLLRARSRAALGRPSGAADDYARAIALAPVPLPDLYLEHSRMLVAAGRSDEAIATLDAGMARLGPLLVLAGEAVEIEAARGRFDAALLRLESITAQAPRKAPWLARRALILERAGRGEQARRAAQQALSELAALPERRRTVPAVREAASSLRRQLARLDRDPE